MMRLCINLAALLLLFMFSGDKRSMGQDSNPEVTRVIPGANYAILDSLSFLKLNSNWNAPSKRDLLVDLNIYLDRPEDRRAFEAIFDYYTKGNKNDQNLQKYWNRVQWIPNLPTKKFRNTELVVLPLPKSSTQSLANDLQEPLPGDVIVIKSGKRYWIGVWEGNRRFPKRNFETSFFYLMRPTARADKSVEVTYSSFPPRLTPRLTEELYGRKISDDLKEKLDPYSPLFEGANGYLAGKLKRPYAQYYWPIKDWPTVIHYSQLEGMLSYTILRRKNTDAIFLKDLASMPCHRQLWPNPIPTLEELNSPGYIHQFGSCIWQTFSDVYAYKNRNAKPVEEKRVLSIERALVKRELENMNQGLEDELIAYFRQKRSGATNAQIAKEIANKLHWEYWLSFDSNLKLASERYDYHSITCKTNHELIDQIERAIRADKPAIVKTSYHTIDKLIAGSGEKKIPGEPFKSPVHHAKIIETFEDAGHYVVVVGLIRTDNGEGYIYYQNGHWAGGKPGAYVNAADATPTHIVKLSFAEFFSVCQGVRTREGTLTGPLYVIGK